MQVKSSGGMWLLALGLLGAIILGACTGLAGEPEIVATVPPPTQRATDLGYPTTPPDLANGGRIFAENCTSCHGINGDGQGELVLDGSVGAMPSFLDASHVRAQTPKDYFNIITQGNLAKLMPPWEFVLSEQERWDVTMYVHRLHVNEATLAQGETLYARGCAECHGEEGHGDGRRMASEGYEAFSYHDGRAMAVLSDDAMFVSVSEGIGESMPAFSPDWSDEQIYAVIAYTRSLGLMQGDGVSDADDSPGEPMEGDFERLIFTGQVVNGTVGGRLPGGGDVFLRYGNFEDGITMLEGRWDETGAYRFEDVPFNVVYDYVVVAVYDGVNFPSAFVGGEDINETTITLGVTIYERTEDPFSVTIEAIETVVDSFTVEDVGTGLVFQQRVTYENASDRVYRTNREAGGGRFASLLWQLPPGAIILNDPSNPRYLLAHEQYALIDTAPVLPGQHQLEAVFFLPYEGSAIIDQALTLALDGVVRVDVFPEALTLISDALADLSAVGGVNADGSRRYEGELRLDSGASVVYELRGALIGARADELPNVVTSDQIILLFLVLGGGVVAGIAYLMMRGRGGADATIEALIGQIADLDRMHEAGHINHDAYQQERLALKARLASLMQGHETDKNER